MLTTGVFGVFLLDFTEAIKSPQESLEALSQAESGWAGGMGSLKFSSMLCWPAACHCPGLHFLCRDGAAVSFPGLWPGWISHRACINCLKTLRCERKSNIERITFLLFYFKWKLDVKREIFLIHSVNNDSWNLELVFFFFSLQEIIFLCQN